MTVGQPGGSTFPTGPGIGATHPGWEVMSSTRAAGIPAIFTVAEPLAIIPGPLGTQAGSVHGAVTSVTRAAGILPIITFGAPVTIASGNAGWADGVGTGAGGWIGAWQWGESCLTKSPIRAAAGISRSSRGRLRLGERDSAKISIKSSANRINEAS